MINTQHKFEAKFLAVKCCSIHKESHKMFQFQGQFSCQGQGQQFSNPSETFRQSLKIINKK